MTTTATGAFLVAEHLSKSFGRVEALRDGNIVIERGSVHALIGDNGAGKSTLVRCLSGVHPHDGGTLTVGGRVVTVNSPHHARDLGIEAVQQNLALVEDLTVWQNLFLSRELTSGVGPLKFLDRKAMKRQAEELVSTLAINVPPVTARVRRLSGGQRQAVAIVRASGFGRGLVIMDEPTAALGVQETAKVEELIHDLRDKGLTILLISHNFDQVLRLADNVTVMRAGRTVAHRRAVRTAGTTGQELVGLVTGAIQD